MSDVIRYSRKGDGAPDALFAGAGGEAVPGWLPGRTGRAPRRPAMFVLLDGIGAWYGITGTAVAILARRRPGAPPHTAELGPEAQGKPSPAWAADSRGAWDAYRAAMPGQGAKGRPKPGSGNHAKTERQQVSAGPVAVEALLATYTMKADVPAGRRLMGARDATEGRLIVTGTGSGRVAYARDREDADAASRVAPELRFGPAR